MCEIKSETVTLESFLRWEQENNAIEDDES